MCENCLKSHRICQDLRESVRLSLYLSLYVSICVYVSVCLYLLISISTYQNLSPLSIDPYLSVVSTCPCLFVPVCTCLYLCQPPCTCLNLSLCLPSPISTHPYLYIFTSASLRPSYAYLPLTKITVIRNEASVAEVRFETLISVGSFCWLFKW